MVLPWTILCMKRIINVNNKIQCYLTGLILFCLFFVTGCGKMNDQNIDLDKVNLVNRIIPVLEYYDYNLIFEDEDKENQVVSVDEDETKLEDTSEEEAEILAGDVIFSLENPMHGVWVASVLNIDYPKTRTGNSEKLKKQADEIINNCAKMGINNIFLQVRPSCDAFYKSEIFPTSKYLTGAQGKNPDNDFDCLKYWIEECHKNNIALHAWVNPYRITKEKESLEGLSETNPARLHPEWVVKHQSNLYFDPGIPEVRQLVIDGIVEIVKNYDVDGIHFDDYFYPEEGKEAFADDATYANYGADYESKAAFRRASVDKLVSECLPAVKAVNPNVAFGISPSGIWANKTTHSEGSNTSGSEAYTKLYADTRKWAKEGWVDYIAPQIYWEIGHPKADYATLTKWWSGQLEGSKTKLFIGLADYKISTKDSAWNGNAGVEQLKRQIELNKKYSNISGEIHYNYSNLFGNSDLVSCFTEIYSQ